MGLFDRFKSGTAKSDMTPTHHVIDWVNKGATFNALGRNQEAIQCLDKALEIDPRYAYAWANKGAALNALGRNQEAIQCSDKALEIDPQSAIAQQVAQQVKRSMSSASK